MEGNRLVDIVERDEHPPSKLAVVGFYVLPPSVFGCCRRTEPSERGEYELGDTLARLIVEAYVRAVRLDGQRVNVNENEDVARAEAILE
jgi:dTDP-glucose pyrophosphorylase